MLIFLYGPDDWRREEKAKSIVSEFKKRRSTLGLGVFDFSEESAFEDFLVFSRSQSVFSAAKMIVLRGVPGLGDPIRIAGELKKLAKEEKTTALLSERAKPAGADFGFLLRPPVSSQKFDFLAGRQWEDFVRLRAAEFGIRLSREALFLLAAAYRGDTWSLMTELRKIRDFGQNEI